jgi:predicted transcriptional regulator
MPERQKTTLYLEAESYRRLKFVARETGTTPAELVRTAISEFLDRRTTRRLPRSLGAGRSKSGDLSERAEELMSGFGQSK